MRGIAFGVAILLLAACTTRGDPVLGTEQSSINVAEAALRGGSAQIALQVSGSILASNPNNAQALIIQGESFTALGRLDDAAASFTAALRRDPDSVGAHVGLGRVRLASDPQAAEALFLEALQREPRNAVALNDLGIARDLQGRHADAQSAYRQAIAADPEMNGAQVNLALSMAMNGRSQDAIGLLRPMASGPGASPQVRHDLAAVLAMSGDRAGAEQILSKDLSPGEVKQALAAYAAAREDNGATLLAAETPAAAPKSAAAQPAGQSPAEKPKAVAVAAPLAAANPAPAPAAPAPVAVQAAPPVTAAAQTQTAETNGTERGAALVQLGAVPSEHDAEQAWQRLKQKMPDQFSGREPIIAKAERDGRVFWRLRTGGFSDMKDAVSFCDHVRQGGSDCIAMR